MTIAAPVAALFLGLPLSLGAASGDPDRLAHGPNGSGLSAGAGLYGSLPMSFEPNLGQTDPEVAFLARGQGYGLFLTPGEAVLTLRTPVSSSDSADGLGLARSPHLGNVAGTTRALAVVRMRFLDANRSTEVVGLEPQPGVSHYLMGNDPGDTHANIPHYARVEYGGVYPGVDLVFHGDARALEYDFVLAPGADPSVIRLGFEGVSGLRLDGEGSLILEVEGGGEVVQKAPVSYQEVGGGRAVVRASYVMRDDCEVSFSVEGHDRSRTLVIDPLLAYSTYLGGSGPGNGVDSAAAIAVDRFSGNVYITGATNSSRFPTALPLQGANAGSYDAFVAKFEPAGSALVYSTYLGGNQGDGGSAIAVDNAGSAYVTGNTASPNFPTASPLQAANAGLTDAFVAKLNPAGSALVYSTYLGGGSDDSSGAIAVDAAGNAYFTGGTVSIDFPTASPLQATRRGASDAFVAKLNPAGSALVYSTYLGGLGGEGGNGIAIDTTGSAHVTGGTDSTDFPTANPLQAANAGSTDAFVVKLDPAGSALVFSTYLGGIDGEAGLGISADAAGNAYVTGYTGSTNFPTANPLQAANAGNVDAFVVKLDPAGSTLVFSTYLGGRDEDWGKGIAVDAAGNASVTGFTSSTDFPTSSPLQAASAGWQDAFVAKLNPAGSALVYSTYLGGNDFDGGAGIALDRAGNAFVAGFTQSPDFPTSRPRQVYAASQDAFVAMLNPAGSALVYSTYLGGSSQSDGGNGIAVDLAGNAYVTGTTLSFHFPVAGPLQPDAGGTADAFVAKLNPAGSALVYSTYLGGSSGDGGLGIAVDLAGSAYVTGLTSSADFPTVSPLQVGIGGLNDAFVAKLNPAGSALVYSTYLGGSYLESGYDDPRGGIAVDAAGNAYVTGTTRSTDFPTRNPLQGAYGGGQYDAFVAKLNPAGSALVYATYLGGVGDDIGSGIAVDSTQNAHVTGTTFSTNFPTANPLQAAIAGRADVFVVKLDTAGSALVYSTYLGGNEIDYGEGLAIDPSGSAYVTGYTFSFDFPTANPLQAANAGSTDAFVAKLDPAGSALVYSTFLGGSAGESGRGISADAAGNAYVTGWTGSTNFPTASALRAANAGLTDGFVAKLNPSGSALVYSTYLGGSGNDEGTGIAVDTAGNTFVTGGTVSIDFPTLGGIRSTSAGDDDAFVTRLDECNPFPGRVARLLGVKALPSEVLFSWEAEPSSAGGYHLYAVGSKSLIPTANVSSSTVCSTPAGQLSCTHGSGLPAPPTELYYQVVGVCGDALSEGPL